MIILARHGAPEVIIANNRPQFAAAEFQCFADNYGQAVLVNPSQMEKLKELFKQLPASVESKRPLSCLQGYNGYSPAELLYIELGEGLSLIFDGKP